MTEELINYVPKVSKKLQKEIDILNGIIQPKKKSHKKTIKIIHKSSPDETMENRAARLLERYKFHDDNKNLECNIDEQWIIDNIFNSKCEYCGVTGWRVLGCDRKDNSIGHTKDNCVPCCWPCNMHKNTRNYEEYMKQIKLQ